MARACTAATPRVGDARDHDGSTRRHCSVSCAVDGYCDDFVLAFDYVDHELERWYFTMRKRGWQSVDDKLNVGYVAFFVGRKYGYGYVRELIFVLYLKLGIVKG